MGRKVVTACGGTVRGKTIAVLGLTFKPNTDDMRDAPSIAIIRAIQDAGAKVRVYDPEGMEQARSVLTDVEYAAGCLRLHGRSRCARDRHRMEHLPGS